MDDLSGSGSSPQLIVDIIRKEGAEQAIYDDVYHIWSKAIERVLSRDSNAKKSARIYFDECDELNCIYEQEKPWGLGFSTNLGKRIGKYWRIEELLIDSNFKTNNEGLDLFAVIGFCIGCSFPLA